MKCVYCGKFETTSISELDRHVYMEHPIIPVPFFQLCMEILKTHYEYKIPIEELVTKFFEIRKMFGKEYIKDIQ